MITSVLLCLPLGSWVKDMCAAKIKVRKIDPRVPFCHTLVVLSVPMVVCPEGTPSSRKG